MTLAVLMQRFKNIHYWFIDTNKMKYCRGLLYKKTAVALELIKDTKKLNVSLAHSNCKDVSNLQVSASCCVVFITPLFGCSRLSLYFQGLNKAYVTSNMFIYALKQRLNSSI